MKIKKNLVIIMFLLHFVTLSIKLFYRYYGYSKFSRKQKKYIIFFFFGSTYTVILFCSTNNFFTITQECLIMYYSLPYCVFTMCIVHCV